jgi:transposase
MDIIVPYAAALDVHNKSITACARTPDDRGGRAQQVRTLATFLDGLVSLRNWLLAQRITQVAMEATSSYWLPVWRVLDDGDVFDRLLLVNARHVKQVPSRKTDVKDATWLCQPLEVGLLAGSFVPPPDVRRLRAVTRYRKRLIQARTAEIQRVEKTLEDAVVKLGAVASKTLTKSGRAMIDALIAGQRDPAVLADLAMGRLRAKTPDLVRALDGRFETHHAVHLRQLLDHIDWFETTIATLDDRLAELTTRGMTSSTGCVPPRGSVDAPPRSSSPRPAVTCRCGRPLGIWRRGRGCHPATTSPVASVGPGAPPPAMCGWPPR